MKKDEERLTRFLQEELNKEADILLEQINENPEFKNVKAPEKIFDKLQQQIRQYEKSKSESTPQLSAEQQELIRLGNIYKRKRSRRKYYILAAAVVAMLAFGITSLGDGKKILREVKDMIAGKEQMNVDSDEERTIQIPEIDEMEAFERINKAFGVFPVQTGYMTRKMKLVEADIEEELQMARLRYTDDKGNSIFWRITPNHRTGSAGNDIEDTVIQEYEREIQGVAVNFKEFQVENGEKQKWSLDFVHKEVHYFVVLIGIEQGEVGKIAENLFFS